ncbi:hypothetical protein FA13DRAFT_317731 [Coprinellus micaceus]|uniref:Ubiquitin-like domain-containing protein n=1 Tax=Coprinellus micaceus TaxID=71717 RepID=A0A4Y7TDG1_COPMI|nr:hypothetical protein FA13DRAFT_317731 [Coprinellus micaceus]
MMNGAPAPLQADDPKARFGDNVDNYDGDADASGSLFDLNTSSFASGVASTSTLTNSAGPAQVIQHFFANASNITIGRDFNSYVVGSTDDRQVQLLVQLLQANLAQHGISQPVGYTRENGVRIVDALGAELILPPSIMRQYSDVHELMLKHFHGKIGEERVVESRYCIVTEHDGTLVQPGNWDRILNSGEELIMCMTVRKVLSSSGEERCPQCGRTRLGTYQDGVWLIW